METTGVFARETLGPHSDLNSAATAQHKKEDQPESRRRHCGVRDNERPDRAHPFHSANSRFTHMINTFNVRYF
jgi:hypothetical protein